jgi:hypothetical protein
MEKKKKVGSKDNQWLPGRAQTRGGYHSHNVYIDGLHSRFQASMERKTDLTLPGM